MQSRLKIGDIVFDINTGYWGHITADYGNGRYGIQMTDADYKENYLMFDCEIEDEETVWIEDDENVLYLRAPGLYGRDGNAVCYEHMDTEDDYPFYSPYLDENLFSFEVFTKEQIEAGA